MRLLSILTLLVCALLFLPIAAMAKPVSIIHQGIKLNAELTEQGNKQQRFFLILHGTLAWHGMELPSTLQTLLEEEEHGSLALSLSYGVTDRKGFYDCKQPITGAHDDAQAEIALWVDYLNNKGYSNIVL
ncbi:MAG: hypothetical protein MJK04_28125, partial [Psychrosphaera sp.]|nr:hypothetical protein [Psychrosphaera sp.]